MRIGSVHIASSSGDHNTSANRTKCLPQFLSIRKTLEANMQMSNLFPPGRVWWAIRDEHLRSATQQASSTSTEGEGKMRLFEVLDVETVFSQVIFARDMLRYVLVLHYIAS